MDLTPKPTSELDWWVPQVIDAMLEERIPFHIAANQIGVYADHAMPAEEGAAYCRRRAFKEAYAARSREFYANRSAPVNHSKAILTGKMLDHAETLSKIGKSKDAADILAQVAKIEGWTGPESTTTIFQDLSGSDFDRLRDALARKRADQTKVQ